MAFVSLPGTYTWLIRFLSRLPRGSVAPAWKVGCQGWQMLAGWLWRSFPITDVFEVAVTNQNNPKQHMGTRDILDQNSALICINAKKYGRIRPYLHPK